MSALLIWFLYEHSAELFFDKNSCHWYWAEAVRWNLDTCLSKLICTKCTKLLFVEVKLNLSGVIGQSLPCPVCSSAGAAHSTALCSRNGLHWIFAKYKAFCRKLSSEELKLVFLWFPQTFLSLISKHFSVSTVKTYFANGSDMMML